MITSNVVPPFPIKFLRRWLAPTVPGPRSGSESADGFLKQLFYDYDRCRKNDKISYNLDDECESQHSSR